MFNSVERRIRKEIYARAKITANEAIKKEFLFKALSESNFNYTIMDDLVKAAQLLGKVEVKFKDGTTVTIYDSTVNIEQDLNEKDVLM